MEINHMPENKPPYSQIVYEGLKKAYGDKFQLTPEEFSEKLNSPEYLNTAYKGLKSAYGDKFQLTPEEFTGRLKKKDSGEGFKVELPQQQEEQSSIALDAFKSLIGLPTSISEDPNYIPPKPKVRPERPEGAVPILEAGIKFMNGEIDSTLESFTDDDDDEKKEISPTKIYNEEVVSRNFTTIEEEMSFLHEKWTQESNKSGRLKRLKQKAQYELEAGKPQKTAAQLFIERVNTYGTALNDSMDNLFFGDGDLERTSGIGTLRESSLSKDLDALKSLADSISEIPQDTMEGRKKAEELSNEYNSIYNKPEVQKYFELSDKYNKLVELNKNFAKKFPQVFAENEKRKARNEYLEKSVDRFNQWNTDGFNLEQEFLGGFANIISPVGRAVTSAAGSVLTSVARMANNDDEYDNADLLIDFVGELQGWVDNNIFEQPESFNESLVSLEDGLEINSELLLPKTMNALSSMALLMGGGKAAAGIPAALGMGAKASYSTGLVASSFLQSYAGYYEAALAEGMNPEDVNKFAIPSAALTSTLELISPMRFLFNKEGKQVVAKELVSKLASGFTQKQAIKEAGKFIGKTQLLEVSQEMSQLIGDRGIEYVAHSLTDGDLFEQNKQAMGEEAIEVAILTAISSGLFAGKPALRKARLYNDAVSMVAMNTEKYLPKLKKAFKNSNITEDQAQRVLNDIETIKNSQPKYLYKNKEVSRKDATRILKNTSIEDLGEDLVIKNDKPLQNALQGKMKGEEVKVKERPTDIDLSGLVQVEESKEVLAKSLDNAIKSIKTLNPNIQVAVARDKNEMEGIAQKLSGVRVKDIKVGSFYHSPSNTIVINEEESDASSSFHEAVHAAIIPAIVQNDPDLYNSFSEQILDKEFSFDESGDKVRYIDYATEAYGERKAPEESISQFIADVALKRFNEVQDPSFWNSVRKFFNQLLERIGISPQQVDLDLNEVSDIEKFAERVAKGFSKGKPINIYKGDIQRNQGVTPIDGVINQEVMSAGSVISDELLQSIPERNPVKEYSPEIIELGNKIKDKQEGEELTPEEQQAYEDNKNEVEEYLKDELQLQEQRRLSQTVLRELAKKNSERKKLQETLIADPERFETEGMNFGEAIEKVINSNEQEAAEAMNLIDVLNNISAEDNTSVMHAIVQLNKAYEQERFDDADRIFESLNKAGTTIGQLLRQFALLNKINPKTIVNTVVKKLDKIGRRMTEEQVAELEGLAKDLTTINAKFKQVKEKYNKNPTEELDKQWTELENAYNKKEEEIDNFTESVIPQDISDVLVTMLKGTLLTSKSLLLNVGGNIMHAPFKYHEDFWGDVAVSIFGKERYNPFRVMYDATFEGLKAGITGVGMAVRDVRTGKYVDNKKLDINRALKPALAFQQLIGKKPMSVDAKSGKVRWADKIAKAIETSPGGWYTNLSFKGLYLGDKPIKEKAFKEAAIRMAAERSITSKVDFLNFIHNLSSKDMEILKNEARKATFSDTRLLSGFAQKGMKTLLEVVDKMADKLAPKYADAFLRSTGKLALSAQSPYLSTPANLLELSLEYTPPGILANLTYMTKLIREGKHREAGVRWGRSLNGIALWGGASILYGIGALTGSIEDEDESTTSITYQGASKPNGLNISLFQRWMDGEEGFEDFKENDIVIDLQFMASMGMYLNMFTSYKKRLKELGVDDFFDEPFKATLQGIGAATKGAMDMPYLVGMSNAISLFTKSGNAFEPSLARWGSNTLNTMSAVLFPNQGSALARSEREYVIQARDKDLIQMFMEKLESRGFPSVEGYASPVISLFGERVKQDVSPFNPYVTQNLDIFKTAKLEGAESVFLFNLFRKLGEAPLRFPSDKVTINGISYQLTEEDYKRSIMYGGQLKKKFIGALISNPDQVKAILDADEEFSEKIKLMNSQSPIKILDRSLALKLLSDVNKKANEAGRESIKLRLMKLLQEGKIEFNEEDKTYEYKDSKDNELKF